MPGKFKVKKSHTETSKKSHYISPEIVLLPCQHNSVLLRGEAQFMVSSSGRKEWNICPICWLFGGLPVISVLPDLEYLHGTSNVWMSGGIENKSSATCCNTRELKYHRHTQEGALNLRDYNLLKKKEANKPL